jgi:hypothetical protein
MYNAGVAAVNLEVLGLSPGFENIFFGQFL